MEWSYLIIIVIAIAWAIDSSVLRGELKDLRTGCVKNGFALWLVEHSGKTTFYLKTRSEIRGMSVFNPEDNDV